MKGNLRSVLSRKLSWLLAASSAIMGLGLCLNMYESRIAVWPNAVFAALSFLCAYLLGIGWRPLKRALALFMVLTAVFLFAGPVIGMLPGMDAGIVEYQLAAVFPVGMFLLAAAYLLDYRKKDGTEKADGGDHG